MPRVDIPMIGRQFGLLRVVEHVRTGKDGHKQYRCICACGNERPSARGADLRMGRTKSCGCLLQNNGAHHRMLRVPDKGHKLIKFIYRQINEQRVSLKVVSEKAGIKRQNLSLMRDGKRRLWLHEIEAALNVLGYELVVREKE